MRIRHNEDKERVSLIKKNTKGRTYNHLTLFTDMSIDVMGIAT